MGFQHVLAIFGATVVAPLIMGFDPNLAIFFSGVGTLIAPVAIILVAENTGHVKAVEAMTDRHLMPYLGRAFGGDGVATMIAGLGGGTGVTTYAENIGVMAITRVYSTLIFVIAALVAIVLGLSPKCGALVGSIPTGVIGGVVTVLFGLIAITGARIWVTNHVDFSKGVNLFVAAIVLIVGAADYTLRIGDFELGGIGLGTFGAIILYQIFKNAPAAWTPRPPPTPCRSSTRASVHRLPSRRAEWSPASVRRAVVIYGARMPRSCRSSRPAGRKSRCASAQPRSDGWRGSTTPGDCPLA